MVLFKLYPQTFKKVLLAEQNIHCGALGKRNRRNYDHVRMPHLHLDRRDKATHPVISNTEEFLLLRMLEVDSEIPCIIMQFGRFSVGHDRLRAAVRFTSRSIPFATRLFDGLDPTNPSRYHPAGSRMPATVYIHSPFWVTALAP